MAISAQRFKFLDVQTNLPVMDFTGINTSDILNRATNDILSITQQLTSLVSGNQLTSAFEMLKSITSDTILEAGRLTRDFYSTISTIDNWTTSQIHSATSRMFPNDPVLQNAFNQVGEKCKAKILAGLGNCMNKKRMSQFNGMRTMTNDRSCSVDTFVNLINHLTGGLYAPKLLDQCALSRMIAGVAIRGFEIGLPNVFSALSTRIEDQHLLAQTGVIVMNATARDGNMLGVMDVANSSVGGMLVAIDPSITGTVMQNFKIPQEYFERDVKGFYNDFSSSMNNLDSSWNTFKFNNTDIPSTANFDSMNAELSDMYQCKNYDNSFGLPANDGSVPIPTNDDYISTSMSMGDQSVDSSFQSDFSDIYLDP